MKFKTIYSALILMFFVTASVIAKPRVTINQNPPITYNTPGLGHAFDVMQVWLEPNTIRAAFRNTGIMDRNLVGGDAGLEWPKGSGKFANFTAGITLAAMINGQLAMVAASYSGEYTPGYIVNTGEPAGVSDNTFKIYSVKMGDNASNNPDYANWGLMVPFGAPYVDVNENGQYDPDVDIPGMEDAGQTLFLAMTDAFPENRNEGEGFGGGATSPLLHADVRMTAWAYSSPGVEELQFVKWEIINQGNDQWEKTYTSVVVDPDLGDYNDDYIGCDTTLNLGYVYNGQPIDGTGSGISYGAAVPAFGMNYFRSPVIRSTNDTLGLTSFVFFTNPSTGQIRCENDPRTPGEAYNMMRGLKNDGSPFINPFTMQPTLFTYPGDPESGTGWTEFGGSVQNCGGTTGNIVTVNPYGDRRFIFNSGSDEFLMSPGDTQEIIVAKLIALGANYLNSVTKLKDLSKTAKIIYDLDFKVTPPPPMPNSTYSIIPTVNSSCNIVLSWQPNAESYFYWDTIFTPAEDTNYYRFQGYEVYEINKSARSLPNFNQPQTIDGSVRLLYAFDLVDDIGFVFDMLPVGLNQLANFPVVPPYTMAPPAGFPNSGLNRNVTIDRTSYPENYGGNTQLIYGQEYHFAIVPYAVSNYWASDTSEIKAGLKIIRSSLGASVIKIRPIAPPAGTEYTFSDGDSINTNRRDAVVNPIVISQNDMIDAKYRVEYNGSGTNARYDILKSVNQGQTFDTIHKNLVPNMNRNVQNENQIVDGVLMKVQRSLYTGVIRDITSGLMRDSFQSRRSGWEYTPSNNRNLRGASRFRTGFYQSNQMSLVYPSQGFYTNVGSQVTAQNLRPVEIEFTGGAGQRSYRFRADTSLAAFENNYIFDQMIDIPFRAYEVDSDLGTRRQINVAIINSFDSTANPRMQFGFSPTADSLGGKVLVYFFKSDYSPNEDPFYSSKNLFLTQLVDVSYVWAPRLINGGSPAYTTGDKMMIYPYTVTQTGTFYEFETKRPLYGNSQVASSRNDLDKVRVVPNPYYGFSSLDRSLIDRFVTFTNLPLVCTIKIYTLNGDLVKTLQKQESGNVSTSSTIEWNLANQDNSPVASGIYIALIDAPGIGQKVEKLVIFTPQERLNF